MAVKYYAVKNGYDHEKQEKVVNKIFMTWNECKKCVTGVPNAKYKSFTLLNDAKTYLDEGNEDSFENLAYVDGSYNIESNVYSYAYIIVKDNVIKNIENGIGNISELDNVRQVGGELLASIKALLYAKNNNISKITIVHDYEGVQSHATGAWARREKSSIYYYNTVQKILNEGNIKVNFKKVDGHSGNLFNEMADEFAKTAAGVKISGTIKKYLKSGKIYVLDKKLKENILNLKAEEFESNIIIKDTNSY